MQKALTIDNLTKVSLEIRKETSEDDLKQNQPIALINFIYGIRASGLTDFEYLITGKKQGYEIVIKPQSKEVQALVSHFSCEFKDIVSLVSSDSHIRVKVTGVSQAENRDIVAAMAGSTACGGSCNCGCGH